MLLLLEQGRCYGELCCYGRFTRLRGTSSVDLLVHVDAAKALLLFVTTAQEYSSHLRTSRELRWGAKASELLAVMTGQVD